MTTIIVLVYINFFIVCCWMTMCLWGILKKTGQKGWKGIVPILNGILLFKTFWKPEYFWITFTCLIIRRVFWAIFVIEFEQGPWYELTPFILIICYAVLFINAIRFNMNLSKAFGHKRRFTVGLVLLPPVFMAILAFLPNQRICDETREDAAC